MTITIIVTIIIIIIIIKIIKTMTIIIIINCFYLTHPLYMVLSFKYNIHKILTHARLTLNNYSI